MSKIELRVECVECIVGMKETKRYDNDETSELIFFKCPKCKRIISIIVRAI